jgi:hypothetical protein
MCKTTQEVGSQKRKGQMQMWTLVRSDRRLGAREIAGELNMNMETVRQIVKDDLGMRILSANMVPRILTHDQKQRRLHISSELLRIAEKFCRVITGDETWCFQYDPETKGEGTKWEREFTKKEKSTHVSVAGQDQACVFLRSQGDGSL